MSQKHRKFSPEFKAKVVLELLEENAALNEIASKYNVLPLPAAVEKAVCAKCLIGI